MLREQLLAIHPDPFARTAPEAFEAAFTDLRSQLPALDADEALIGMMRLVALHRDGHTSVSAAPLLRDGCFFPVRVRAFDGDLHVTTLPAPQRALVGARVLAVGDVPAADVLERLRALRAADNAFSRDAWAVDLLTIPAVARVLGLSDGRALSLTLEDAAGAAHTLSLASVQADGEDPAAFLRHPVGGSAGHAWAVLPEGVPLPRHLDHRDRPWWYEVLPDGRTVYLRFASVRDAEDERFVAFHRRLFEEMDARGLDRLIVDLRWNDGGDGELLWDFVYGILRRDAINRPGHLYVLTSGWTFSAAVMATARLRRHTEAILVGAPTGAGANHHGDARTVLLPESGIPLRISTLYWQEGHPADRRNLIAPDHPAPFTAEAWFAGRDPALEAIEAGTLRPLEAIFESDGLDAVLEAWETRRPILERHPWWQPFELVPVLGLGAQLLAAGDAARAEKLFAMATEVYPDEPETWEGLARARDALGAEGSAAAARAAESARPSTPP